MVSLQEQLLKAGLVDKGKVKQANHDKSRQKKVERRTGTETVEESRLAALEAQKKQAERARELNAQRDAAAARKAVQAQIAQLVQQNRQPRGAKGADEVAYNYTLGSKIERIHVSAKVRDQLVAGRLVIVAQDGKAELVPKIVADKIAERDPDIVVRVARASQPADAPQEDDPYADYKIPDDFTW
jgi:uncharacterized protein YaiL (DUF2058 family)